MRIFQLEEYRARKARAKELEEREELLAWIEEEIQELSIEDLRALQMEIAKLSWIR